MYLDALRDLLKDLVNLCGEEFDPTTANSEITLLDNKIIKYENQRELSSFDKTDLEILKIRKEYWENSAVMLGTKILEGFQNKEDKDKLKSLFKSLYERANTEFKTLNSVMINNSVTNIWDLINSKNIELIKLKSMVVTPSEKNYSEIAKHYNSKKELIENVLSSLDEKLALSEETISLYNNIIDDIKGEIKQNTEALTIYNEKKYKMAFALCSEVDYMPVEDEINKLIEIKKFNENQLKIFEVELEGFTKEKETIEREINFKTEELKKCIDKLDTFKLKEMDGEYKSKEDIIEHNFQVKVADSDMKKLNLQKNLLYVSLDKLKETGLEILSKYHDEVTVKSKLENDYPEDEATEIENLMKLFDISKDEAIKTLEVGKQRLYKDKNIDKYMNEFGFSAEEAEEAIRKEKQSKFWVD